MSKAARHRINAVVLALLAAHALYWFATGQAADATTTTVSLRAAQAVVGLVGAVWFFGRSRGVSF